MADDNVKNAQTLGTLELGKITPKTDSLGETEGGKKDKKDFFKFTLDEKSDVNIVVDDLTAGQNVDLYLRSANGRKILDKSEGPAGEMEFISASDLEKGTYVVEVRGKRGAKTDYKLTMRAAPESEGNKDYDTPETSKPIVFDVEGVGETESGEVGSTRRKRPDQQDYYNFELDQRSRVDINLDAKSAGRNANLILESLYGETVTNLKEKGDDPESVSVFLDEGQYFLKVTPTGGKLTKYDLGVNIVPDVLETDDKLPGVGLGSLESEDTRLFVVGEIGFRENARTDTQDWYTFNLPEIGDVEISMDQMTANANFRLFEYDPDRNKTVDPLAHANKKRDTSELYNNPALPDADYAIQVDRVGGARTEYALEINVDKPESDGNDAPDQAVDLGLLSSDPSEWPKSDDPDSEPVTIGSFIGGSRKDREDWYKFTVDGEEQQVVIRIQGMTQNANIRLYEDSGSKPKGRKGKNFSEGGTNEGKEIVQTLEAGNYYVKVEAGRGETPYTIEASALVFEEEDPINVGDLYDLPKRKYNAPRGTSIGEDFGGTSDDTDTYTFSLSQDSEFTANLKQLEEDADLRLLDASGREVNASESKSADDDFIEKYPLAAGDYTLQVVSVDSADTSYRLDMSAKPATVEAPVAVGSLGADEYKDRGEVGDGRDFDDTYTFTLGQASDFVLNVSPTSADIFVQVLDSTGASALPDSDSSGIAQERIKGELAEGSYEVKIFAKSGIPTEYFLNMSAEPTTATVTDDTPETAVAIGAGDRLRGDVSVSKDALDYYKFSIDGSSEVTARLSGLSGNADLKLVSAATGEEWVSENGGRRNETIDEKLEAGEYYAVVEAKSGRARYTLQVNAEAATDDLDGSIETATDLGSVADPLTNPVEDSINVGKGDVSDYYKISASAGDEAIFNLADLRGNADLLLLDSAGEELAKSDSSGTSEEIIDYAFTEAGEYYLQVTGSGSTQTAYTLNLIV